MVFVREIRKGGKVYRYLYKSKRVDGKVKSIYVGREEVELLKKSPAKKSKEDKKVEHHKKTTVKHKVSKKISHKPEVIHHIKKNDEWIIDKIIEFNKLMEESMDFVIQNKIEVAANRYNRLLSVFNQLSHHVGDEEKVKLYNKTKQIYDRIQEINS